MEGVPIRLARSLITAMNYWLISLVLVALVVIAFLLHVHFMVERSKRRAASGKRHRKPRNIPSYKLYEWVDNEVNKGKLYRKPDMTAIELADELDLSVWQLNAIIRKAYSKSVSAYLNERRVQAACRLLREQPDMLLDEISSEVGFPSLQAFQSEFNNAMGQKPDKYRRVMTHCDNVIHTTPSIYTP